jgi:hypothetical protein
MGRNVRQKIFTFHDASTTINNGIEFNVGSGMVTMNIAVTTNNTNGFTIIVEAMDNDFDEYTPVSVVNLNTFDMSPNITSSGKYQLGLEGHIKVRCKLLAITSNKVTVIGTAVD